MLLFICSFAYGQNGGRVQGHVYNKHNHPLADATIVFAGQTTSSDTKGSFFFPDTRIGVHQLRITAIGYKEYQDSITVTGQDQSLTIQLLEEDHVIEQVEVTGRTETQRLKEQAIRTTIVDTRAVAEQPATLTELMNRTPGLRVRQIGGLGSPADLSMNGFQGRAIRYFRNGIPMTYLGNGYGIHNIPINSLERVEVYKGVLPIYLGADALGGAVNIVPRRTAENSLNASYEIASFSTHRLSLNMQNNLKNGWYTSLEAFHNATKNDYKAYVMVPDPETKNSTEQQVTMYHNGYSGTYVEGILGIADKLWAKDLHLSLAYFNTEREQQHPALMTESYGKILSKQHSFVPSVRYKANFFDDRLSVDHFMVLNTLHQERVDTAAGSFDWYGNFTPISGRVGESSAPALSDIALRQFTSRTNLGWVLDDFQKISLNYVYTGSQRSGSNPLGPRFTDTDIDVLSVTSDYAKQVLGMEWSGKIKNTWDFSLMGKWYNFNSKGIEAWANRPINLDEEVSLSKNYFGAGGALKYAFTATNFLRFSTEYAYRLPESDEVFGDAVWIVPNFSLEPERSLNFNLGYHQAIHTNFHYEINAFYRKTKDLIALVSEISPYAQYKNFKNVRGYGLEFDMHYYPIPSLRATGNATIQSFRLFGYTESQQLWQNGARLQNMPYFFYNIGLNNRFKTRKIGNYLDVYLNYNFVREFYLETIAKESEPQGFLGLWGKASVQSDVTIPNQHLLSAGANYRFLENKYTVGVEVKNLMDSRVYDYFRVQRAGRSFHLKVTYQMSYKK